MKGTAGLLWLWSSPLSHVYSSDFPLCSNSSALPSVGEMAEIGSAAAKKDVTRKNSVMLPNGSGGMIESSKTTGSSLAAAGSNVIGGIDNYKRY